MTGLSARQRGVLLVGAAAYALILFDQTATTTALSDIERDLGASVADLHWVFGAYLIGLAALTPVAGRVADLYGRRLLFVVGMAVFGIASLGCALAPSVEVLIGMRALQGVGGAFAMPLALANVSIVVPEERRGWAVGVLVTGGSILLTSGPVIGGALVDLGGWRTVFGIAVPIVAVALLGVRRWMAETREAEPPPLDVRGLVLLATGLGALVTGLLQMSEWGADAPATLIALAAGVVLLAGFVVVEHRIPNPLIALRLFTVPAVAGYLIALLAAQFAVTALTVELMLYLQRSLGYGALAAGALFVPAVLGTPLLSPTTGRLEDRGLGRILVTFGLGAAAVALVWIAAFVGHDDAWILLPALALFGLARPFVFTPASAGPLAALPPERHGLAGGLVLESYQLGAVAGVAVAGVIVSSGEAGGDFDGAVQAAIAVAAGVSAVCAVAAWVLLGRDPARRPLRPDRRQDIAAPR
ncbi:MAG TPA: MFS transporter [Capillimicrobium sp.]|nr:MFS transporter [Capillimicrobium sp.]